MKVIWEKDDIKPWVKIFRKGEMDVIIIAYTPSAMINQYFTVNFSDGFATSPTTAEDLAESLTHAEYFPVEMAVDHCYRDAQPWDMMLALHDKALKNELSGYSLDYTEADQSWTLSFCSPVEKENKVFKNMGFERVIKSAIAWLPNIDKL